VQAREDSAAVDVSHHDDRKSGGARESHVGDVALAKVHLGEASRPLTDHNVEARAKVLERVLHDACETRSQLEVLEGVGVAEGEAHDDDLGARIVDRLEEHRVHGRLGSHPSGEGLRGLRARDLGAVAGDMGVERHVLGLVRSHSYAGA
jgi:hypothetical protein